jgi:hypothetical protein
VGGDDDLARGRGRPQRRRGRHAGRELRTADSAVAPVARATPLPAGTELTIGERRGDWVRVHLAGTLSGWLPAGAVERVAR